MSSESISGDAGKNQTNGEGVSRRSVIKAGAHAVWAVPLVQVVAAAPAMAAVSGWDDGNKNKPPSHIPGPKPPKPHG